MHLSGSICKILHPWRLYNKRTLVYPMLIRGYTMLSNLRFALRQLSKTPGFAFVAIATLAVGIGACTAMFSIIDAVLLKPLPFHEPDRLVWIENSNAQDLSGRTTRSDTFL